jgi:hypothetical protein
MCFSFSVDSKILPAKEVPYQCCGTLTIFYGAGSDF